MAAIATLDRTAKKGVSAVQQYALISGRALGNLFHRPFYGADIITQADIIGVGSIPIVLLTGFFTGGVLALQSASTRTVWRSRSHRTARRPFHDQGTRPGAHQPHGFRTQRLRHGQ